MGASHYCFSLSFQAAKYVACSVLAKGKASVFYLFLEPVPCFKISFAERGPGYPAFWITADLGKRLNILFQTIEIYSDVYVDLSEIILAS